MYAEIEKCELFVSGPFFYFFRNLGTREVCTIFLSEPFFYFFTEQFTQEFKHDDGHDFDENGGQWHLLIAIRPDGPQGVAYHPQCYSDKGKYFS